MRITIDTSFKTIRIDGGVNLGKLMAQLQEWLGEDWLNYELEVREKVVEMDWPSTPWQQPVVTEPFQITSKSITNG